MSTSRTTTQMTTSIGSIPITGGANNQLPAPTRPTTLSASNKAHELELDMECNRERMRRLKEKRRAKEEAKRKAEEVAARRAAEEEKARQEAAAWAALARKIEEEAAEKRRLTAAAEAAQNQVEIPRMVRKGKGQWRTEASGGEPDDGNNGNDDDDDDDEDEWAPCQRCRSTKISCQMQAGKRSSIICKPCHDAKVRCSYSNRPFTVKREGGAHPTGKHLAVLESQIAQLLADNWHLQEGQVKANTYHRHTSHQSKVRLVDDGGRQEKELAT
ncbi:hypothetical protein EV359DRAFT_85082 [Lentinula novae-zelandiae]|nr:hypothetical protein EV359DRAFT_85082 [Lentinula novae-zelandiae]